MNSKIFTDRNGLRLIVKNEKSAVVFEMEQIQANKKYNFSFEFASEIWRDLLNHIETISNELWVGLNPKEMDSIGSDYYEYYDRKLDNNGYLTIRKNKLLIERPSLDSGKLYQFNKKRMESFIYDFKKI